MKKLIIYAATILSFIVMKAELVLAEDHGHEHSKKVPLQEEEGHDHSKEDRKKSKLDRHKKNEPTSEEHVEDKANAESENHGAENGDHEHEKAEGHEEEGGSAVGPDKGILEKGENGFRLSPEAIESFELKMQNFSKNTLDLPRTSLVEIKDDKFVYRIRDGWIKKVSVKVIKKNKETAILELSQFKIGDQIIISGTGFVRVSELVAEEGVSHGHSH